MNKRVMVGAAVDKAIKRILESQKQYEEWREPSDSPGDSLFWKMERIKNSIPADMNELPFYSERGLFNHKTGESLGGDYEGLVRARGKIMLTWLESEERAWFPCC